MKKIIAITIICTVIGTIVYGQKNRQVTIYNRDSVEIYLTKFQKVVFVTPDSIHECTRFIKPNGEFYFWERFVDTTGWDDGLFYQFEHPFKTYRLLYENSFLPVDTIYSYFPINDLEYYKIEYTEDSIINIYDELKYSYILKQIGEPNIINSANTVVRLIEPCEYLNPCTSYTIVTIRFFANSAMLYSLSACSVDYNGIQLIRKDSCLLKPKDFKNITKQLNSLKSAQKMTCRRPGNPWTLEYSNNFEYKHFIISGYCLREKRMRVPYTFTSLGLNYKYFGRNCPTQRVGWP